MSRTTRLPDGAVVDDEDIWNQILRPAPRPGRPGLFLDRDGTVIEEAHFLCDPEGVRLIPGAAALIAQANRRDIPVIVVTNQSGIGRGYYGWTEFATVQARMLDDLAGHDADVDAVFACPHHHEGKPPFDQRHHPARKPGPGMLTRAAEALGLNLTASWIIGDHATDIEAGLNGGLAGAIHVLTGHGHSGHQRENALAFASATFRVEGIPSIADAAGYLPFLSGKSTI